MRYKINPDRKKPWNNLPAIPIEKEIYYSVEVLEALVEAKTNISLLEGRSVVMDNPAILINTIALQEAKSSTEIENIFTTNDELYKAFGEEEQDLKNPSTKEVLHYKEALLVGIEILNNNKKFGIAYFEKMYQIIKQAEDGIRKPFIQTIIRKGGTDINAGETIYTPPRGKGILEQKMKNLVTYLNTENDVDPLIKMAIAHFQFEAIHPFSDGNGRVGRILNIHYLVKQGLLHLPILYLSKYILQNKSNYYFGIADVSQRGDWKNWIIFMLKAIAATSKITYNKINDIINTKNAIAETIKAETKITKQELLVNAIFTQPFSKVKHLTSQKIYAENTARKNLEILVAEGILEKKIIEGHHYYKNKELCRILEN